MTAARKRPLLLGALLGTSCDLAYHTWYHLRAVLGQLRIVGFSVQATRIHSQTPHLGGGRPQKPQRPRMPLTGPRSRKPHYTSNPPPCPRQESNLDLPLRRRSSYPLDYEGSRLRLPTQSGPVSGRPRQGDRRTSRPTGAAAPPPGPTPPADPDRPRRSS